MTDELYADGEAWTTIDLAGNQVAQHNFLADMLPGYVAFQAGWGAGKTWAGARKLLALHLVNACAGLVVAPTDAALWLLCVPELERACQEWGLDYQLFPHGHGKDKKPHMVVEGQPIWLFSAEEPRSITGFEVGHIWCDEYARYPASRLDPLRNAAIQIRGRLRNKAAKILQCCITTTPEGTDTPIQRDFVDKPLPNHRLYVGSTRLNTALPGQFQSDLLGAIPAELVDQYLDGKAVNYVANRAHPTFSQAQNVRQMPWIAGFPVHIGQDYNVSPMCWLLVQHVAGEIRVLDELVIENNAQVDLAMRLAHERKWGDAFVTFHPDKSAKARSTVGDPEFVVTTREAARYEWNYTGNAAGVNPPVDARINHVSRLIRDGNGVSRLFVHPRCVRTISDLEATGRGSTGYDPGPENKRGHILDALGYVCWDLEEPFGPVTAMRIPA